MSSSSSTEPLDTHRQKRKRGATARQRAVLLAGPLPHHVTGVGLAFASLVAGFRERAVPFHLVDLGTKDAQRLPATLAWNRVVESLGSLLRYLWWLPRNRIVYLIIGTSRVSFLRDALMIWSSRLFRRRLVLHLHGGGMKDFYVSQSRWLQTIIQRTFSRADVIVVLAEALHDQFDFLPDADAKIQVVPNALPSDLDAGQRSPKKLEPDQPVQLLYLSNLIESKGYLDVLEASRILHQEQGVPVQVDFAGRFMQPELESRWTSAQDAREFFLNWIGEEQLHDIVCYQGVATGAEKQRLLEKAHILVLPTYNPWEGQPLCIIEAFAYGCPVIATAQHGILEQVIEGSNGFFVKPKRPNEIADRVEQLWREPSRYSDMSANALRTYQDRFSRQVHLDRLLSVILGQ